MRDMAGGSYRRALASTFVPEFLSMNLVMAGIMLVASLGRIVVGEPFSPLTPEFWFVTAYPVRDPTTGSEPRDGSLAMPPAMPTSRGAEHANRAEVSRREIVGMLVLSVVLFALAFVTQGELTALIG